MTVSRFFHLSFVTNLQMKMFFEIFSFILVSNAFFVHVYTESWEEGIGTSAETLRRKGQEFQNAANQYKELKEKNRFQQSYLNNLYTWYLRAYGDMPHDLRKKIKKLLKWTDSEEELKYKEALKIVDEKNRIYDPNRHAMPFPEDMEDFNLPPDMS